MLKVTVVCENTVGTPENLVGEWGLCLYIEKDGRKILFDTGEQGNLLSNAAALGLDLKQVEALVLSHGHSDHTGGLRAFLRHRGRLPVYAHPALFTSHYSADKHRYIGVPFCREVLENAGADFVLTREPREILPGLWVSGEIPRETPFEKPDNKLYCQENGKKISPDPLLDDLSLYCVIPEGLVILLGCAHAGLVNIIKHARKVTGVSQVYAIIGGTHLGPAPASQQEAALTFLQGLDLCLLAANHCTGLPVIARLASLFGSRFRFAPAGSTFTLPLQED
ncbi:MAG TPA: MBL fold metallo-hydrolase [Bacillota bacterium]|jgi:7,8-dihydropterin-6-yl-methyl-4-(beta-D-ribofuranosyl)aminobenzene 5'-phosphate synthase|nr:MBL fold metallo-hydrolase [Peptococcaceae bacterium MAG4]NLW37602.1 MBL fold metallo-hydrolase [Peptococcaceae bacterium]HPZ42569.1 MBL fold metallo-hydrolase [Bacillota bacterium]HUM58977.1 MBL fold metallo-hydrolase [Bacillota bacterium]